MNTPRLFALSLLSLSLLPLAGWAQAPDPQRKGPSAANIEEYRKKAAEQTKTALKATDDEWAVLQPMIENVRNRQRDTYSGRSGFGRPDRGNNGTDTPRPGQEEARALQTTLEDDSSSPESVKVKLTALRDARKKAQAALTQAREELRKVLTTRQEAVLVAMGILE